MDPTTILPEHKDDATLTKLRALTTSEDTPEHTDAQNDPEYLEGLKIGQNIIRQMAYGRKRTKKHRGAQKGAFGSKK